MKADSILPAGRVAPFEAKGILSRRREPASIFHASRWVSMSAGSVRGGFLEYRIGIGTTHCTCNKVARPAKIFRNFAGWPKNRDDVSGANDSARQLQNNYFPLHPAFIRYAASRIFPSPSIRARVFSDGCEWPGCTCPGWKAYRSFRLRRSRAVLQIIPMSPARALS